MFAAFRGGARRFGPPLNTPLTAQCVYMVHMDSQSRRHYASGDVMTITFFKRNISKTLRDTGFISIDDLYEVTYAALNGHMTDNVRGPYDIIPKTL